MHILDKFEAQHVLHRGFLVFNNRVPDRRHSAHLEAFATKAESEIVRQREKDIENRMRRFPGAWPATETTQERYSFVELLDTELQKSMGDPAFKTYLGMDDDERILALRSVPRVGEKVAKLTGTPLYEDWEAAGKPDFAHCVDINLFLTYVSLADMEILL